MHGTPPGGRFADSLHNGLISKPGVAAVHAMPASSSAKEAERWRLAMRVMAARSRARMDAARFDKDLGEFVLDYDAVRTAADPDATLLAFLESTYAAAADLAHWDRAALECERGRPGVPRPLHPRNG